MVIISSEACIGLHTTVTWCCHLKCPHFCVEERYTVQAQHWNHWQVKWETLVIYLENNILLGTLSSGFHMDVTLACATPLNSNYLHQFSEKYSKTLINTTKNPNCAPIYESKDSKCQTCWTQRVHCQHHGARYIIQPLLWHSKGNLHSFRQIVTQWCKL